MAKVTGRVTIEVDGETLESEAGATLNVGGVTREPKTTETGKTHYIETTVSASVECSILHIDTTDLTRFASLVDATVNFKCDTGQVYSLAHSFLTEPPSLSGGAASLKFTGEAAKLL